MSRTRSAFTLIELLVCIGIISILASLLFPVLTQVREFARSTVCINNMQQIGSASTMYLQDYDETYALTLYVTGDTISQARQIFSIYDLLFPYIAKSCILQCPTEPEAFDYAKVVGLYGTPLPQSVNFASYVPNPGLFTCGCRSRLVRRHDVRAYSDLQYPANQPAIYEGFMSAWLDTPAQGRHRGGMNIVLADGHTHSVKLKKNLSPEGFDPVSTKFVDQWIIDKGPFRLPPDSIASKKPMYMMFGIVTDPECVGDVSEPCTTNPPCE